jgi:hypothetical protein
MNREAIPRPDGSAADTVVVVSVNVVTVISVTYQTRPVVIDHARRPEGVVTVQTGRADS